MKYLFLLALLCVGVYAIWDDYIVPYFPREITLINKDGNMVEITPIRRDEKKVYFLKEGKTDLESYEIAKLNFLSRCKIKLYTKFSPKPPSSKTLPSKIARDDPAQMHLNNMHEEYEDILERIELLKIKKRSADHIYTAQALDKDIKSLSNKANSLIYKIEDLKYRYPHLR